MHMVQLMPLHPKTLSSLASFKSRLVLPFRYRLTQVVLEKRPVNGCSRSSSVNITRQVSGVSNCHGIFLQFVSVWLLLAVVLDGIECTDVDDTVVKL